MNMIFVVCGVKAFVISFAGFTLYIGFCPSQTRPKFGGGM